MSGYAMLQVGKQIGTDTVFISVPEERYDTAMSVLTDKRMHIILIEQDELTWLIESLQREREAPRRNTVAWYGWVGAV